MGIGPQDPNAPHDTLARAEHVAELAQRVSTLEDAGPTIDHAFLNSEYRGATIELTSPSGGIGVPIDTSLSNHATLLDCTDPLNPTVADAGIYAATASIAFSEPPLTGANYTVVLHLDAADQDFVSELVILAHDGYPLELGDYIVTLNVTGYVPAGGIIKVTAGFSTTGEGGDTADIHVRELSLQRIT